MGSSQAERLPGGIVRNARSALHILLFLVLPETPDDIEGSEQRGRRGDVTAWFTFWGLVAGFFCYGLFMSLVRVLSITAVSNLERLALALIPVMGMALLAPTFAAWFGTPREADGLANVCSGRPGSAGIVVVCISALFCFLLEIPLLGVAPAALFFGVSLLLTLAVPHVLSRLSGGTSGVVLAISCIVVGVVQFVAFVLLVV